MSNVRGLFSRRDEAVEMPSQHVLNLVLRSVKASEEGDLQAAITELCHAVYVGTFKGPQGISEHELIHALRGIAGFGFPLDGDAA